MTEKDWYSNKDLFEMLQEIKAQVQTMIRVAKEYNGLRQSLNDCIRRVTAMEERAVGRYTVGKAIREWGGWFVALLAFLISLYKGG